MLTLLLTILWGISLVSAGHVLLTKRDPRASLGWIVACLALPGLGAFFYWLLGVNRIRSRARELQEQGQGMHWLNYDIPPSTTDIEHYPTSPTCQSLIKLSDAVTRRPLLAGNEVKVLFCGEQAYPEMLDAIRRAKESIFLSSYIFQDDRTGKLFVRELIAAVARGVDVRVLIDAFGELYSFAKVRHRLKRSGVKISTFLPVTLSRSFYMNMRNHRKLLLVDNEISFTGGMNISDRHLALIKNNPRRVIDIHFMLKGPICCQLRDAFMEDWHYATNEKRHSRTWPEQPSAGTACCRGISAGPNEQHEKLNWILIGALACARSHVRIMTPYFIPSRAQLAAINAASLRGVRVEILLPEQNNLPFVAWAASSFLFEVLEHDSHVYYQPPPFVHSKLFIVDDEYALVGSANFDPRSLRLNFEFNVEIFAEEQVRELIEHFDNARDVAHKVTLEEVDKRSLPIRLRDSFCKLFSPYL